MVNVLKKLFERLGYLVIRRSTADDIVSTHPWLADRLGVREGGPRAPAGSSSREDHPRLAELRKRYAGHPATAHTVWTAENLATELDVARFRADNAYVWQTRVNNPIQYLLSTLYVKANDPLGLFDRMSEDGAFGAHTYEVDGRLVSRDMLDSILEIGFLEDQIGLSKIPNLTVLDIGAGYGRLAHRMAETLPNLRQYLCTDGVAESTFVSERYMHHRGVEQKVRVVPLDEIDTVAIETRIEVAVNIHSFSECPITTIEFWLDLVARAGVPWLFVVPNDGDRLVSWEPDQTRKDFLPLIRSRGYELVVQRAKYHRSADAQRFALFPATYFLFRRTG